MGLRKNKQNTEKNLHKKKLERRVSGKGRKEVDCMNVYVNMQKCVSVQVMLN